MPLTNKANRLKLKASTPIDQEFNVWLEVGKYFTTDNMSLRLYTDDDGYSECLATITCNFSDKEEPDVAYIDAISFPWIIRFINDNCLGYPTGKVQFSGYGIYPQYKFNLNEIKKYTYNYKGDSSYE